MTSLTDKILVDTNVLLYTVDASFKDFDTSTDFLEINKDSIVLTHQVANEYIRIATHPSLKRNLSVKDAMVNLDLFKSKFPYLIFPNSNTLNLSLKLMLKYNIAGVSVFDTYLAATALTNNVHTIATYNAKDFKVFQPEGLSIITF